jgi:hypothetical protein
LALVVLVEVRNQPHHMGTLVQMEQHLFLL